MYIKKQKRMSWGKGTYSQYIPSPHHRCGILAWSWSLRGAVHINTRGEKVMRYIDDLVNGNWKARNARRQSHSHSTPNPTAANPKPPTYLNRTKTVICSGHVTVSVFQLIPTQTSKNIFWFETPPFGLSCELLQFNLFGPLHPIQAWIRFSNPIATAFRFGPWPNITQVKVGNASTKCLIAVI